MISLLFLTYDNILHDFTEYFKHCDIYIHPKYPRNIIPSLKRFVIRESISTEWGNHSIVNATLALLENAYKNKNNDWFILLSEDTYPLLSYEQLREWLKTQKKSIFHFIEHHSSSNLWKTSQWWALTRDDVKTILLNANHYVLPSSKIGAPDELYFLSLLKQINPQYQYSDYHFVYDKWLSGTIQKSPAYFNSLLDDDVMTIRTNNSFFIRKILKGFKNRLTKPNRTLVVLYVGTETNQRNLKPLINSNHDIVVLSAIPLKQLDVLLTQKAIQIHNIIYKFFQESMISIKKTFPLHLWEKVVFLSETFDIRDLTLSLNMGLVKVEKDRHGNSAYHYSPVIEPNKTPKIAFLFLTRSNINHPDIWERYLKGNMNRCNVYFHPKNGNDETIPLWLKKHQINNLVDTEWGFITEAYFSLLREALKNKENTKFVVISESCLPLRSFDEFYQKVIKTDDERTSYIKFLPVSKYDFNARIKTQNGYNTYSPFVKHYARFCLSRYHVEKLFLYNSPADFIFFNKMHVGDEFFLTLLNVKKDVDFVKDFEITYDNWEFIDIQKAYLNDEIKKMYELGEKEGDNEKYRMCIVELKELRDKISANPYSYKTVLKSVGPAQGWFGNFSGSVNPQKS